MKFINKLRRTAICATALLTLVMAPSVLQACKGSRETKTENASADASRKIANKQKFEADSAYDYISRQVKFGPRVPGTAAHKACGDYLVGKLRQFGADSIIEQHFTATAWNGDRLPLRNIMGRFGTDKRDRVLLIAHYDTRPWADRESRTENIHQPIPGANDGGSGVGVILELARQFSVERPEVGVDILFADGEDYGDGSGWTNSDSTWCLGTQHWAENLPDDYRTAAPRFGILLDMVGAPHARFHREYISDLYAQQAVDKIWSMAAKSGYSRQFVNRAGGSVIDDHLFVNTVAGIPTVDIIDANNEATGSFPASWHTLNDDMTSISKASLRAAGQTVSNVIYYEKAK